MWLEAPDTKGYQKYWGMLLIEEVTVFSWRGILGISSSSKQNPCMSFGIGPPDSPLEPFSDTLCAPRSPHRTLSFWGSSMIHFLHFQPYQGYPGQETEANIGLNVSVHRHSALRAPWGLS